MVSGWVLEWCVSSSGIKNISTHCERHAMPSSNKPSKVPTFLTGFAIGGVSPIGHKIEIPCFADETLRRFETVWAAAGAYDAVFEAQTGALLEAANAVVADLKG